MDVAVPLGWTVREHGVAHQHHPCDRSRRRHAQQLAADAQGGLYAGAVGDFGVLEPDSTDALRYHSLIDKVDVSDRVFQDVWGTHVTGDGVYFQTYERLFRWDGNQMNVWRSMEGFRRGRESAKRHDAIRSQAL